MKIVWISIFFLLFIRNVFGLCSLSCYRQNTVYGRVNEDGSPIIPGLLRENNRTTSECYARSGLFTVIRRNNGTHDLYSCGKTVITNGFPDVIASFVTDLKIFEKPPTICDVCDGNFIPTMILRKDPGCNIPAVCRVQNERQVQCSECLAVPEEVLDDGLCCDS
ncbi:ADAM22 [Mytilus coruscus]|uniref:ADAM22 n=1 Tax=Mytilus coruscus TaxID=42192 RepID=A0A6J8CGU3_MYTCO|nr:ADAM22 [Mytilus coruscus]